MTGTFLCHHHDAEEIDLIAAAIKAHANEFRKTDDLAYPQQRLAREIQDQQNRDGFITGFAATSGPIGPCDLVMPCGPNGPAGPDPPLQNAWLDDGEKLPVIGEMAASHGLGTQQEIRAKPRPMVKSMRTRRKLSEREASTYKSIEDAAHTLQASRRWLQDFLHDHPGIGFKRGGRWLLTDADIIQTEAILRQEHATKCRSNSSRPAKAKARTGTSVALTSEKLYSEAQRLIAEGSRSRSARSGNARSKVVSLPVPVKPRS
jgi:hypothetical protein